MPPGLRGSNARRRRDQEVGGVVEGCVKVVWYAGSMNDKPPAALPTLVAWLGYGGLIPFIFTALGARLDGARGLFWSHALVCYGASIVSFLGALYWGFAMTMPEIDSRRRHALYLWSVVPAITAWIALLLPDRPALMLLVGTLGALVWRDRRLVGALALPGWYLPLRLKLSVVAAACLLVVAAS